MPLKPPFPQPPRRLGAIILARLDSSRLPRKGLIDIQGKPLLGYVVERVKAVAGVDDVALATSSREVDAPLADFAKEWGISLFRGNLNDVAGRVLSCARKREYSAFLRVNGDSPFFPIQEAQHGVEIFRQGKHHMVTNVQRRTFPPGMSVEIIDRASFAHGYQHMHSAEYQEHVTKFFYEHPHHYLIHNFESWDHSLGSLHLALDTPEDLERIERIFNGLGKDHLQADTREIIALAKEVG